MSPIPSSVPYPAAYALQVIARKKLAPETTPGRRMRRPRAAGRGRARGAAGKGPGRPQDNAAAVEAREGARAVPASLSKASLEPPSPLPPGLGGVLGAGERTPPKEGGVEAAEGARSGGRLVCWG